MVNSTFISNDNWPDHGEECACPDCLLSFALDKIIQLESYIDEIR